MQDSRAALIVLRPPTAEFNVVRSAKVRERDVSTTVASMLPVWSSPGRVWEGRSGDVCCDLVRVAGGLGTRVGGAQGADRTGVRQGRNTGDRRSLSRWLVVRGRAQNRLAAGRAGGA